MSPRKSVERELSREMVLTAARELFVQKGYQQVSMRQIATSLGYSHGALYYHFKSKADIFFAIVEQDFALLDGVLEQILEKDIPSQHKIKEILLGFIEFGLRYPAHYEIMFLIRDTEVQSYVQNAPDKSYEKFALALHKLCEKQISIQQIWSIFLSLHGFVAHYCRCNQTFDEVRPLAIAHVEFLSRISGQ